MKRRPTRAEGAAAEPEVAAAVEIVELSPEDEVTGEFPAIVIEELETVEAVEAIPNGTGKTAATKVGDAKTAEASQATLDWADDGGPPTMHVPAAELLDDDDPYMAELRHAIVDPSPLGPRTTSSPTMRWLTSTGATRRQPVEGLPPPALIEQSRARPRSARRSPRCARSRGSGEAPTSVTSAAPPARTASLPDR